jgi:hypothetical protein
MKRSGHLHRDFVPFPIITALAAVDLSLIANLIGELGSGHPVMVSAALGLAGGGAWFLTQYSLLREAVEREIDVVFMLETNETTAQQRLVEDLISAKQRIRADKFGHVKKRSLIRWYLGVGCVLAAAILIAIRSAQLREVPVYTSPSGMERGVSDSARTGS